MLEGNNLLLLYSKLSQIFTNILKVDSVSQTSIAQCSEFEFQLFYAGLRIRIDLMRIRIQNFL